MQVLAGFEILDKIIVYGLFSDVLVVSLFNLVHIVFGGRVDNKQVPQYNHAENFSSN